MNRRELLISLGLIAAAKPLIFDMGANLWKVPAPTITAIGIPTSEGLLYIRASQDIFAGAMLAVDKYNRGDLLTTDRARIGNAFPFIAAFSANGIKKGECGWVQTSGVLKAAC